MGMKTYLVSYGTPAYNLCLLRHGLRARKQNVDEVRLYTPTDICNTDFYQRHQHVFCQSRGAGYWLWKPYIILQTMKEARDNDVIIYCDAALELFSVKSLRMHLDGREGQDIFLFRNMHGWNAHLRNRVWTKRDAFILMDADQPRYWDAPQVLAGFIVLRNNETTRQFVTEWLDFAEDERILTDMLNTQGKDNHPKFVVHRHDQSILSILAERHHIDLSVDLGVAQELISDHRDIGCKIYTLVWLFLRNPNEGMKILRKLYGRKPWQILPLVLFIILKPILSWGLYLSIAKQYSVRGSNMPLARLVIKHCTLRCRSALTALGWFALVRLVIKHCTLRVVRSLKFRIMRIIKVFGGGGTP